MLNPSITAAVLLHCIAGFLARVTHYYCISVNCVIYVCLQYFDTVGWVLRPVKNRHPYNLYCVGGDVKPCSINQHSSSIWTAFTDLVLGPDLVDIGVCLFQFFVVYFGVFLVNVR